MSTNCTINGKNYYRICRKIGMKRNRSGAWVDDYKNFYGKTRKEAEQKYAAYMQQKQQPEFIRQPFGSAIEEWIRISFESCNLAPTTKRLYVKAYFRLMALDPIAATPLQDLKPLQLQTFINELQAPASQIQALHKLLRRFYKFLALNYEMTDITTAIELPQSRKNDVFSAFSRITVWNYDELQNVLLNLEKERFRLLVILAINTGARFGELLALQYNDIRGGQLYITKQTDDYSDPVGIRPPKSARSNRVIPLSVDVLREIELHRAWHSVEMQRNGYKTDFIFTTCTGELYYKKNIYTALRRYYERIGVTHHRFYDFRHTFATMLSENGTPIEVTSALLGHENIATTAKYYVGISTEQKLAAISKINSFLTVSVPEPKLKTLENAGFSIPKQQKTRHDVVGSSPAQTTIKNGKKQK